jgi:hypothetical protein
MDIGLENGDRGGKSGAEMVDGKDGQGIGDDGFYV